MAGLVLLVAVGLRGAFEPADVFVDRWLRAVSGDGPADRGWSQLDETSRERFGGDAEAFRVAVAAQDWSGFRWDVESAHRLESWLSYVYVTVDGGLRETPAFLRDNGLVGPWCIDDTAPGINLQVEQEWPWSERTLGPGILTGSAERALTAGACIQPAVAPPQFLPGNDPVWTGQQLAVWNWTTLPLFLLDKGGHRVGLPPCGKVGLDSYATQFEVRAADGYVMAFRLEVAYGDVTTFVVIGSRDEYVNNAPPAEPMPPCEGQPLVQVGE